MEFVKITKDNFPKGEVLCQNYRRDFLLGHISYNDGDESFTCESENEMLVHVTHFMIIEPAGVYHSTPDDEVRMRELLERILQRFSDPKIVEKYQTHNIYRSIITSIQHGNNPYNLITDLIKMIDTLQDTLREHLLKHGA